MITVSLKTLLIILTVVLCLLAYSEDGKEGGFMALMIACVAWAVLIITRIGI